MHSTVKARWAARDPVLVQQVQRMIENTDCALSSLLARDSLELAKCMSLNFSSRRLVYGDATVGALNVRVAEQAQQLGLAAKFTGSGGAFLCLRQDGQGW